MSKGSKEFKMLLSFLFEGVILINLQRDHFDLSQALSGGFLLCSKELARIPRSLGYELLISPCR